MKGFEVLCWLLAGVLMLGVVMPPRVEADDDREPFRTSDGSDDAVDPVAITGSYRHTPLRLGSRSDDDSDYAQGEPSAQVTGSYSMDWLRFDPRGIDEVLPPVPTDILDPPFDRYVDLQMLRRAWQELDPAMLADAALQLAEGERVLLRSHKAFKADDVLSLAIAAAAESRDTDTLERLTKAVARSDNADLKAQIDAVAQLASESRVIDPAMMLSVEKTSVAEFATLRDLLRALRAARIAGDRIALDEIQEALEGALELPEMPRDYLLKMTAEARAALPEEEELSATANTLEKLGGESRGWFKKLTGIETPKPIRDFDRERLYYTTRQNVVISNRTNGSVIYSFGDGPPTLLASGRSMQHTGYGRPEIRFNNGAGRTVSYVLPRYNVYYFQWNNGVLDLHLQPRTQVPR